MRTHANATAATAGRTLFIVFYSHYVNRSEFESLCSWLWLSSKNTQTFQQYITLGVDTHDAERRTEPWDTHFLLIAADWSKYALAQIRWEFMVDRGTEINKTNFGRQFCLCLILNTIIFLRNTKSKFLVIMPSRWHPWCSLHNTIYLMSFLNWHSKKTKLNPFRQC